MSIFLQIYVFFFLHILFIVSYLIYKDAALYQDFFGFIITIDYPKEIIEKVIIFNLLCFSSFLFSLKIGDSIANKALLPSLNKPNFKLLSNGITLYLISFIIIGSIGILNNGLNYWALINYRESINFIFELRVVGILLIVYSILSGRKFTKLQLFLLFVYFAITIMYQARSVIIEFILSIFLAQLFLYKDKIKIKYIIWLFFLTFAPNAFVIIRQWPLSLEDILHYAFSFEYLLTFNLLTAEAINSHENAWYMGETFIPSLYLFIPSIIRDLFDIDIVKSMIYTDVSNSAGVFGGSFSLLAELFLNFSWSGWLYFVFTGFILGYYRKIILRQLSYKQGYVSMLHASFFPFYIAVILSLRNDLGVFIKYSIQLFIIATVINYMFRKNN